MSSINDHDPSRFQKIEHCILIDGNFGRHELFSNIHPYVINRINQLNDASLFNMYIREALNLMSMTVNTHYHICYYSASEEIDEYYKELQSLYSKTVSLHRLLNGNIDCASKFEEIVSKYECNYIWIVHGSETQYGDLVQRLKLNDRRTSATIFSYSWLENVKESSNRIEYLTQ